MMNSDEKTRYIEKTENHYSEELSWVACLVVLRGASAGDKILLDKAEVTIGRAKNTDVCLAQDEVSRLHAVVQCQQDAHEERFLLIDKNSTNGTLINAKNITAAQLKDQDLITIGNTILKFVASTNPEQAYYDELYRQTHLDKALRIYNKQYFLNKLSEEISRCLRYGNELSLILFDVDHFKHFNDTYGHLAGDAALVQLADRVKQRIRDTDIFCRYGGEEFAIIMPHVNRQQAYLLAEHIRTFIAELPVNYAETAIAMTISLGISGYFSHELQACTRELLIDQADKALYQAKRSGRNKTMLFCQQDDEIMETTQPCSRCVQLKICPYCGLPYAAITDNSSPENF